jgi:F420H(2)-dependent quinone reductase
MTNDVELSPTDWVRRQTETILRTGTTEGITVADRPIILVTTQGAKSGKLRYVPVMRVEDGGTYTMIASKGGTPEHPAWYHNVKANPEITVQDGTAVGSYVAREISGDERQRWWDKAVEAYPPYAEYQQKTDRVIPVFLLEPASA